MLLYGIPFLLLSSILGPAAGVMLSWIGCEAYSRKYNYGLIHPDRDLVVFASSLLGAGFGVGLGIGNMIGGLSC